jgi:glycerol-3-phosphate dehydrogenase (NAD(P)+)
MNSQKKKIAVIGAGAWGTALARLLAEKGNEVSLWFFDKKILAAAKRSGENPFLKGFSVKGIKLSDDLKAVVSGAEIVVLANPAQSNREILKKLKPYLGAKTKLLVVSKGIELKTFALMSDVIKQTAPKYFKTAGFLSGPSFASELAEKKITIVSIASRNFKAAREFQHLLATDYFRPYVSRDIVGVQIGGAVKNVIAVASGIVAGLDGGENAKAALITRGLAEISRLGLAMGAKKETFMGSAGLGDLLLTASSCQSRNFSFGYAVGQGQKPSALIKKSKEVVEGYWTTKAVWQKAKALKISMAITDELYQILFNNKNPKNAMKNLMARDLKQE